MNHIKKTNTFVLIILSIIDVIIIGGYIQDAFKGNITMQFGIVIAAVTTVTLIADYVTYFLKKDGAAFKFVTILGYIIVYGIAMFNSKNDLVFAIAFPIYVMYVLYLDTVFMGISAGVFLLINMGSAATSFVKGSMPSGIDVELSTILLQVATIGVTGFALTWITYLEKGMKNEQVQSIANEKNKTDNLLTDVLELGNTVKDNSNKAEQLIEELNDATLAALETLKAVAESNNDNAKNIENQTMMTGNIQEMILSADADASQMERIAGDSLSMVSAGREIVETLEDKAAAISQSNSDVMKSINDFVESAVQVRDITEKINGISSQTNLLSLNASIESARAGEAGRGFAVVADEIRNLADETQSLTAEISGIVQSLESNALGAKDTVGSVVRSIDEEQSLIDNTKDTYVELESMFKQLYESVADTQKQLKQIVESNNAIVDSIGQLSASSEEVAASMDMAVELSNNNMVKTKETKELMQVLTASANELDKYNN